MKINVKVSAKTQLLGDWCDSYIHRLSDFREDWNAFHKAKPEEYPLEMAPGEWDKQFAAWQSSGY